MCKSVINNKGWFKVNERPNANHSYITLEGEFLLMNKYCFNEMKLDLRNKSNPIPSIFTYNYEVRKTKKLYISMI